MTQNVPMLKEKSEGQVNLTYGRTHIEGQGAYSPIKNWMVVGNTWREIHYGKGFSNEGGIGYYHLGQDGNELEVLGLFTYSQREAHIKYAHGNAWLNPVFISYPQDFKAAYTGYSLQLNTGRHLSRKGMQIALTIKYSFLRYTDFYYLITEGEKNEYSKYKSKGGFETDSVYTLENMNQHMFVGAFTFKVGGRRVKYMAQVGLHLNFANDIIKTNIPPFYSPIVFSNVLQISFNLPGKQSYAERKRIEGKWGPEN
jgi:hypothetical protein